MRPSRPENPDRPAVPLPATAAAARVVLLEDGELEDVAAILGALRVEVARVSPDTLRAGRPALPEPGAIVVAPARTLLGLEASLPLLAPATRVAIADGGSRTARARLRRAGVDFLVGRTAHPEVLRLFFARLVYRGPEKRFAPRLAVGLPVSLRSRLRRRNATLIELSRTGAQIVCDHDFAEGSGLTLYLPHPSAPRSFSLRARVVRRTATRAENARFGLGLALEVRTPSERADLAALLAAHAHGPSAPASLGATPSEPERRSEGPSERRLGSRRSFAEPLLACSDLGARVVMGRDLSTGGLRVEGAEGLEVGRIVTLALHDPERAGPISVRAHVVRATRDGDRVLRFIGLDAETRRQLQRLVEAPASIQTLVGSAAACSRVVTEIADADAPFPETTSQPARP